VTADLPSLLAIYRDFHAHPELGFSETRSAAILAAEARKLGFTVTTGVGKTGVVAVMKNGPGPTLMLRADMDALPVTEQTGLAFASKVRVTGSSGAETGVMHACGHDTHMTTWIGTARRMAALKSQWSGTLVMIGQPSEENVEGANAMLTDGLFSRFPKPDVMIAFHDMPLPAGTIGYTDGYTMTNSDGIDIIVKGVGGHGAAPHLAKDPIVLASRIVLALQTLVSREINPLEPAVVTVGSFHSGTKRNIISEEAVLQLTVRSYSDDVRQHLRDGIARIARGEAIAAGLPEDKMPVVKIRESANATFNTHALTSRMAEVFTARFGKNRAMAIPPLMPSEDFSQYWLADKTKQSLIFWVGGVPQAQWDAAKGDVAKLPGLHSPTWAPDAEKVIATATEAMTAAALDILARK
jgi:hippurate hydrolase